MIIKNKKILCISTTAFYNDRGCHVRIENVINTLKKNNQISLITYNSGKNRENINTIRIKKIFKKEKDYIGFHYKKLILDFFIFLKSIEILKKEKFNYVLCFTHEAGIIGLILSIWYGKIFILDYQGSLYSEIIKYKKSFFIFALFIKLIERAIEYKSDFIIYNTKFNYNKSDKKKKYFINDNYVPIKEREILSFRENKNEKLIVWIGVFTNVQGYRILFDLIKKLNNINYKFVIIGYPIKEEYKEELKDFNVVFTGKIDWEYLPDILRDADLCISTKQDSSEGSSKLFLYKKYCKNIISMESKSTREILNNNGIIVKNINEMIEKIKEIL